MNISEIYPSSNKIYINCTLYPDVKVGMRQINIRNSSQRFLLYDTAGPYTDCDIKVNMTEGISSIRRDWIARRNDTYPICKAKTNSDTLGVKALSRDDRVILKGIAGGAPVTQLFYAKNGIITPEMEYVAVRENALLEQAEAIPGLLLPTKTRKITPEFVREEVACV
ncbi:hypothetical protein AB9K21_02665 [Anaplasma phagocytophilum]|uniref:ThiC-associated domain protein n=1 Tax=Anaplasma phagocytophilum str. ApNP TaxID=1359153 RepID=A0A0F3NG49_ANAPH|nr:thiC-associated domain protein [Anaplasma phagocytophilum str. ApNP]